MTAEQKLRDGKLDEALADLQQNVRDDPSNSKLRVFLFQLLVVQGQWQRALNQLNVAAELDPATLAMAQMYREALRCEVLRAEIFAGQRSPVVFGQPPEWIGWMIEALRLGASDHHRAAQPLRERAFDAAQATAGAVDDAPFEWIADADPRLGPILEGVVNGQYYWIPFENIRHIVVEEPADLRDFVWLPAHFTWVNGGEAVGLIPTRYPGTERSEDEQLRLARKTEWRELEPDLFYGVGQRLLVTDASECSLMDIRKITLNPPTDDTEGDPDPQGD